jgi:hypothetical protein
MNCNVHVFCKILISTKFGFILETVFSYTSDYFANTISELNEQNILQYSYDHSLGYHEVPIAHEYTECLTNVPKIYCNLWPQTIKIIDHLQFF